MATSVSARVCPALAGSAQVGSVTQQRRASLAGASGVPLWRPRQTSKRVLARAESDSASADNKSTLASLDMLFPSACVRVEEDEQPEQEILECRVFLDEGDAATVKVSADKGAGVTLLNLAVPLPLGVVFEEVESACICVEIDPEGNAAGSLQVGDVLRACTAAVKQMSYPAGNLLFGGIGRPVARLVVHRLPGQKDWTGSAFNQAMTALQSHRKEGRDSVSLVVERRAGAARAKSSSSGASGRRGGGGEE